VDVLVTFEPGRGHYLGLFVPVIRELRDRGRKVAIMVAPNVKLGPPDFGGAPTFTYTAYATIDEYRKARASFARLGPSMERFSQQFRLTPRRRQRLSLLLQ